MIKTEISIERLRLYGYHGVEESERKVGNEFEVSVKAWVELDQEALQSDDIGSTLSYADIAREVKRQMHTPSQLLEHVAWRIVESLAGRYASIERLAVTVAKLTPPLGMQMERASVTVHWSRSGQ